MEVKIRNGDKVELVELEEPLGKHQRQWFKKFARMQEKPSSESIDNFLDFRDELILELGKGKIKKEDLDSMPLIEKNKMTDALESRFKIMQEGEKKDFTAS